MNMAQLIADLSSIEALIEEGKVIPVEKIDAVRQAKQLASAIELMSIASQGEKS